MGMHLISLACWLVCLPSASAQGAYGFQASVDAFTVHIGATASFQGKYVKTSMNAYRALRLAEERINSQGIFKTTSGEKISVKLTVYDDESSKEKVVQLYQEMLDSGQYDFFIGPYSSGMSLLAAQVINKASRVMMLHAAASPSIYEDHGFRYVFSTNPIATDYFANGLEMLRDVFGAQTVTFVRGTEMFHHALCDGAIQHAKRLDYKILGNFSSTGADATAVIREARGLRADVFIGCGHFQNIVSIAVTSRSLMYSPPAMLMTQTTSQLFIDAIEAKNANFIMGPTSWDKSITVESCRVFGSSKNFFDLYRQEWNMDPTYHSASAASSIIAIMFAAESVGTPSPKPDKIRDVLLNSVIKTFAARLQWFPNGKPIGLGMLTQQVVPYSSSASPAERYTQSEVLVVTQEDPPRFPAPTWEQRELEVYPCPAGTVMSHEAQLNAENPMLKGHLHDIQCDLCPAGKSRNNVSLVCRECQGNSYGDQVGLTECIPCAKGMSCNGSTEPVSAAGFYRLEKDAEFVYYECDPPELCLGGNKCLGDNIGVLCGQCPLGFTNRGWRAVGSIEKQCNHCAGVIFNIIWFLCLIGIYITFITVLSLSDRSSAHSLSVLHGVIMKIMINYGQFMTSVMTAADFQFMKEASFLNVLYQFLLSPLQSFLNFDCVSRSMSTTSDKVSVMIGWLLIPVGLFVSWCFFALLTFVFVRRHRWRRNKEQKPAQQYIHQSRDGTSTVQNVQPSISEGDFDTKDDDVFGASMEIFDEVKIVAEHALEKTEHALEKTVDAVERAPELVKEAADEVKVKAEHALEKTEHALEKAAVAAERVEEHVKEKARRTVTNLAKQISPGSDVQVSNTPSSSGRPQNNRVDLEMLARPWDSLTYLTKIMDPNIEKSIQDHLMCLWTRTAIISVFILHPIALQMLIAGMYCVTIDRLRLMSNLDVVCNSGEHTYWLISSIAGLFLYGLGIPLFTLWKLYSLRNKLLDITVRRKYGFLYNGFEPEYYYFEVFYMIRKFLITFAAAIPETYARILTMLWMGFVFMGAQIACRPWDNRGFFIFDKLETLNLLALIVSLGLRLVLEIRRDIAGTNLREMMEAPWFTILVLAFVVFVHVSFWILAVASLVRSTTIRRLQFKREVFPESLKYWQKLLCKSAEDKYHRLTMHPQTHLLECEKLGTQEKYVLSAALQDTLEQYVKSGANEDRFQIEYLGCAIREAFARCEKNRQRKVEKLLRSNAEVIKMGTSPTASHGIPNWFNILGRNNDRDRVKKASRRFGKAGITVEEFQVALMLSWSDISKGRHEYFQIETEMDQEDVLNAEAAGSDLVWKDNVSLTHMLDILHRRDELNCTDQDLDTDPQGTHFEPESHIVDLQGALQLMGMEAAREEPRPSSFAPDIDNPEEYASLLKEHEQVVAELIELQAEAMYLRSRCHPPKKKEDEAPGQGPPSETPVPAAMHSEEQNNVPDLTMSNLAYIRPRSVAEDPPKPKPLKKPEDAEEESWAYELHAPLHSAILMNTGVQSVDGLQLPSQEPASQVRSGPQEPASQVRSGPQEPASQVRAGPHEPSSQVRPGRKRKKSEAPKRDFLRSALRPLNQPERCLLPSSTLRHMTTLDMTTSAM